MMAARKYKDPFGRLFYNAQRSAINGPKGSGQKILDPDYIPRKIDFTIEDLKDIYSGTNYLWDEFKNTQIFITGGTGFFGTWILESFIWANKELNLNTKKK